MDLPIEGVFHDCAIIAIRKTYPGQARKIMNAVWGMGQMMFTKFVVVVDEHVDVHDYSEVTWRVFNNVDPARDTVIVAGGVDVVEHAPGDLAVVVHVDVLVDHDNELGE